MNRADCQAHLSESRCILSGPTSRSCQCRTCHIIQPNRLNISLPSSHFAPHPPTQTSPRLISLSCFQSYGRPGQFVSASTAVSSAGPQSLQRGKHSAPTDRSHDSACASAFFCARLWIHVCVCVWGRGGVEAAGCPLLNQPCRVDSAHRALRAVNNNVSAKGSQTQPARWRQSLPPPAHIKSTYRTGDRGRWI